MGWDRVIFDDPYVYVVDLLNLLDLQDLIDLLDMVDWVVLKHIPSKPQNRSKSVSRMSVR